MRVRVIFPEARESADPDRTHMGKTGTMTSLDKSTGQADVTFDGGEAVTIAACCLQELE
jgi:hypothetical protein